MLRRLCGGRNGVIKVEIRHDAISAQKRFCAETLGTQRTTEPTQTSPCKDFAAKRSASALNHANNCTVCEIGRFGEASFIVRNFFSSRERIVVRGGGFQSCGQGRTY
jgi:hypothetical protein